jgi:carbonic anhydrase
VCDAAVVWCFDDRFQTAFSKLLKRIGMNRLDPIKIAGGAKQLASPKQESDRQFILEQIQASKRLHATKLVILMVHSDCGAYGGLSAFNNDPRREATHHEQELQIAAQYVYKHVPDVAVQGYFVDFEGVWEADVSNDALSGLEAH